MCFHLFFPCIFYHFVIYSLAQKADNGGLSVQEYSPGSNERSLKAFHKHLQSSEFNRVFFDSSLYSCTSSDTVILLLKLYFNLQVRSKAQTVLFSALGTYNFCCRDLIPHVLEFLNPDNSNVTQQQFKVGFFSQAYMGHSFFKTCVCRKPRLKYSLFISRVPCIAFWVIPSECAWQICMTGSALL